MEAETKKFRIKDKSINAKIYGLGKIVENKTQNNQKSGLMNPNFYQPNTSRLEIIEEEGSEYKELDSSKFRVILQGACIIHLDRRIKITGEFKNNKPVSTLKVEFKNQPRKNILIKYNNEGKIKNSKFKIFFNQGKQE